MPIATPEWMVRPDGSTAVPSNTGYVPTPEEDSEYFYVPRKAAAPLIPPQWVPIQQYHSLVAEVQRLRERVAALEKLTGQWQGE